MMYKNKTPSGAIRVKPESDRLLLKEAPTPPSVSELTITKPPERVKPVTEKIERGFITSAKAVIPEAEKKQDNTFQEGCAI